MWYINKATELQSGNGLPFAKYLQYISIFRQKTYQDSKGFMHVPTGLLPSFQIHVPEDTFVNALLANVSLDGTILGSTAIPIGAFNSTAITKNGANLTAWEYDPTYTHAGAVDGLYFIDLTVSLAAIDQHYYSEVFVMQDCC